jgi:hypothetical protein
MTQSRSKRRRRIKKAKSGAASQPHEAKSANAGWDFSSPGTKFLHIPFALKKKQTWSRPRQSGLPKMFDDSPNVFFRHLGHAIEKQGIFEHTDTEDLRLEIFFRINELARRAAAEERDAGEALASVTGWAVHTLETIASQFLELLQPVARKKAQWPAFISPHPEFKDRNRRLLSRLQVGQDTEVRVYPKAKWRSNRPATSCVIDLIDYIRGKQDDLRELRMLKAAQKKFPEVFVDVSDFPSWVKKCEKLPPLNKDSVKQWWDVAKVAFLEGIPHPEDNPDLRRLAIKPSTTKALYDSEIRSLILRRLKAALKAIART